jgi:FMN reductase
MTVLVGNPKPASRTRSVALCAAGTLRDRLRREGCPISPPRIVDLAEIPAHLLLADAAERSPAVHDAFELAPRARLLLVASPTFKGTFTGLLKLFADMLPQDALRHTVAVPVMTAASSRFRHASDSYLRPLLEALGATVPVPGLSVLEAQFGELEPALDGWAARVAPVLAAVLDRTVVNDHAGVVSST